MAGQLDILEPMPIAQILRHGNGGDASVVLTPDPKEAFVVTAGGSYQALVWDMGEVVTIDAAYVGGIITGDRNCWLQTVDDMNRTNPVTVSAITVIADQDATEPRHLLLDTLDPAGATSRYFSLVMPAATDGITIGRIAVGKRFSTEWGIEWGSGRRVVDTSQVTSLQSGGFGVNHGAKKAAFSWTFGDLTDEETEQLFDMQMRLGSGNPVIVRERRDATTWKGQRLHHGLFRSLDRFERRDPNATKWKLEIENWI